MARPAPGLPPMSEAFDILFVADPRFEGGTSTALAAEIDVAARAGFSIGLLMVKGALLGATLPVHPQLASLIDRGAARIVDPDTAAAATLAVIHHPIILENLPLRRVDVAAKDVVLVLHHPRLNGAQEVEYDLARTVTHARTLFGSEVFLAPVSRVVRDTICHVVPPGSRLLPEDWLNVLSVERWPARPERAPTYPVVIGRHARPDGLKWPRTAEEAFLAYPADPARYRVRALGAGDFLFERYGTLPANWDLLPFDVEGVPAFLQSLDFYVYFHDGAWSEAFGRTVLEALAAGLVVILPPSFKPAFGIAAIYVEAADVERTIAAFVAEPKRYLAQARLARDYARRHFDEAEFLTRLDRLFDLRRPAVPNVRNHAPLPRRRLLFVSTNGIGLGHLTQQLAIADRLPEELISVFATMSTAMRLVRDAGYQAHFLTYHKHVRAEAERWNRVLAEELFELIAFLRPRVVAYDGTMPFAGLLRALDAHPSVMSVWVRRPMWRESHAPELEGSGSFAAIVEPGEIADAFDTGPTKREQPHVFRVPPVLHLDPRARLSRNEARRALGLEESHLAVALQLGSEVNYPIDRVKQSILAALVRQPEVVVLEFISPIRRPGAASEATHARHRIVEMFPTFAHSRAFDLAVTAAGYNTFHENVLGGVPTIFVPNEAGEMDLQVRRALFAEVNGLGFALRRDHDHYAVEEIVARALDRDVRARLRERCEALPVANGADEIARFIAHAARFVRMDRSIEKVQ